MEETCSTEYTLMQIYTMNYEREDKVRVRETPRAFYNNASTHAVVQLDSLRHGSIKVGLLEGLEGERDVQVH